MARVQQTVDFIINAVLNGGFSSTFTEAQREFIRLGEEIKNLQAIQRDIGAYQKQSAAVQNTTEKLENLKQQYALVEQQIKETTGSTTALEREKLKLSLRIGNTEAALERQQQRLGETKDRLDAAGISTDNLAGKNEELKKKVEELTEEQKEAAEEAGEFQSKGVQAIEAVSGAITAAGIAGAIKEIKDGYRECVSVAGDFEQAMSAVEAIADSSQSEMAALTAEAKELGATTKFTAQESANAMEYMAMAGWDAQEMLDGMNGVVNLAAAAGEDLAQVSDIVTDNLSAFGLAASDTAHFADVLAAAAANSNTNISIMGETFKSSSSVAGALGYSIEDVAVMVGLMANNAVKGSRAGTALRNIFNGLLDGVTLTAAAFGELDYSAVNSDGSMKGLMETVEDLRGYFDQMTEAEKVSNAMTLAGLRGYNGLLAILKATDEDFQSLYASINDCTGAAERMASVKLDNLNGDITIMNSAMEALQDTIGEQFNPELRELTQFKTEALNWINEFIQLNPALTKGVMAGAAAFGVMGTAIVGVNAAVKVFKTLELATLFTGPAGKVLAVAAGIAAVTGAVASFAEETRDGGAAVRELTEAARAMDETLAEAGTTCEETTTSALAAANVANTYIDKLEAMGDMANASDEDQKQYQNTLALLLRIMPELSDCISTTSDEYGRATYTLETTTEALRTNAEAWKQNAKAQAYQAYMNTLMEQYGDVLLEAAENEIGLTQAQNELDEANRKYKDALAERNKLYESCDNPEFTQEYWDLTEAVNGAHEEVQNAQASVEAHKKAIEKDAEAIATVEAEMNAAEQAANQLTEAMERFTDGQADTPAQETAVREALDATMASAQELAEAYEAAYNEALESFSGQFGLFDEAQADAEATVAAAQKALDTQLAYWQAYEANIAVLKETSAEDLGVTQENYNALMEYVRAGTPEAAGLAADMVKHINDGNTQALTSLADTIGAIEESQAGAAGDVTAWAMELNEQMDQLVQDMEDDIAALDMSEDAAESGRATIQAFLDAADGMLPQVQSTFARIAARAQLALSRAAVSTSSDWDRAYFSGSGYAEGTSNAPPGWSWVGEEGPELIRMHGGEQVLPSSVSQEVAQAYSTYSRYSGDYAAAEEAQTAQRSIRPAMEVAAAVSAADGTRVEIHFHIEAGASPDTVSAMEDYVSSGALKAAVLEAMEDAQADARRRTMA